MMDKIIAYQHPETGGVSTVRAIGAPRRFARKYIPAGLEYVVLDEVDVPEDQTFRDAWALRDGRIVVDIEKAREIAANRLRVIRNSKFAALDVAAFRHLEAGHPVPSDIVEAKQALRDLPARVHAFDTVEGLKHLLESNA